jgi:hypothetical protein
MKKNSNKTMKASVSCILILLVSFIASNVAGYSWYEEITYWNGSRDSGDTDNWVVTNFNNFTTNDSYSFNKNGPFDYDESEGSITYGNASIPGDTYDTDVSINVYFDPCDPSWGANLQGPFPFPYPVDSPFQPFWSPIGRLANLPPYMPLPETSRGPDMYSPSYPTSYWNITNDTEHIHYPEWTAFPFLPGQPLVPPLLPYSIAEFYKHIPPLAYTDPNWNYMGLEYDGVKFWINVDSNLTTAAVQTFDNVSGGNDPYENFGMSMHPDPDSYLELGHVSLVNSTTGYAPLNLGFVAEPSNSSLYHITDSSFMTTPIWNILPQPAPHPITLGAFGPLPYNNPYMTQGPPFVPLITDVIARPEEGTGLTYTTNVSFTYSNTTTSYALGTDLVESIDSVYGSASGDITVSGNFGFANFPAGGGVPDQIVVLNPQILTNGETLNVSITYKNPAGLGVFETDTWYQFEIVVNWNTLVDWNPTLELRAYDEDGFQIGLWGLESLVNSATENRYFEDWTPDTFYSEFAHPVYNISSFGPWEGEERPLLKIEDIKTTTEANISIPNTMLDYLFCKNGSADWNPPVPVSHSNMVNRTVNVSFTTDYPPDTDSMFDPWLPIYGSHFFEMTDPLNDSNFVWLLFVPYPLESLVLNDIADGTTENVTHVVVIIDGTMSGGKLAPPAFFPVALNNSIKTNLSVEWNELGNYTISMEGINITGSGPSYGIGTFTYSNYSRWAGGSADRIGSGVISYVGDAGYNVTMNIHDMSMEWEDTPAPPVLETPIVEMYNTVAHVHLNWSDSPGTTTYNVFYQNNDDVLPSHSMTSTSTNYTTVVLNENGNYSFWVTAVNGTGESNPSNNETVAVDIPNMTKPDLDVTGIIASDHRSMNVTLNWTSIPGSDYYQVWKNTSIDFSTWLLDLGSNGTTGTTVTFNITQNGSYYYKVRGIKNNPYTGPPIQSPDSDPDGINVTLIYPGTPVISILSVDNATGVIHLDWNSTANGDRYLVYSSTNITVEIDPSHLVRNLTGTGVNYTVNESGTYYFVVIAVASNGATSDPSNIVGASIEIPQGPFSWLLTIILAFIGWFVSCILSLLGLAKVKQKRAAVTIKPGVKCPDGGIDCDL